MIDIPHYQVQKKIGEGAMSEVFLALNSHEVPVAIKVLRHHFKENYKYIKRIKEEASNLSLLEDERIVRYIDATVTSDNRPAIIEQYVEGKTLEELMSADGFTPRPIIGAILISEILLGLEEAHRQQIIHRDLKPENIMITESGRIKITDFGISKRMDGEELTMTGMLIGSPAFMSPEQAEGKKIGPPSDFFSLGALLYKFACGQLPFDQKSYTVLIKAIISDDPIPVEKRNPQIHPELKRIIHKTLHKDPKKRYQKAYQFRYDLMQYLDHVGIPSPMKVLKAYYQGQILAETDQENIEKTLMVRAEKAFEKGEKKEGLALLRQVFALAPHHKRAKTLLLNHRSRNFRPARIALYTLFYLLFLRFDSHWRPNEMKQRPVAVADEIPIDQIAVKLKRPQDQAKVSDEVVKKDSALSKPISVKKPEPPKIKKKVVKKNKSIPRPKQRPKQNLVQETARPKSTPASVRKKRTKVIPINTGFIRFNLDPDITVFINGHFASKAHFEKIALKPGYHQIRLLKPGFAPIDSNIDIKAGETTTINAKRNQ